MIPFRHRDKGTLAAVGRRAAIAPFRDGLILRGALGWAAWFGLHLFYLVGFRKKLTVLINWTWRYLNWTSGPRIIGGDQPDNVHLEPATIAPIREHIALQTIPTGSVRSSETPTPPARQRTGCALVPTISAARGSAPHIR